MMKNLLLRFQREIILSVYRGNKSKKIYSVQIETPQALIDDKIVVEIFIREAGNGNKPIYFKSQE